MGTWFTKKRGGGGLQEGNAGSDDHRPASGARSVCVCVCERGGRGGDTGRVMSQARERERQRERHEEEVGGRRKKRGSRLALASLTKRVVVEQLLDQVDVRHEHAAAAVPGQAQGVEGVAELCQCVGRGGGRELGMAGRGAWGPQWRRRPSPHVRAPCHSRF